MKRILCMLLVAVLVFSLLATAIVQAFATEEEATEPEQVAPVTETEPSDPTEPTEPEEKYYTASQACVDMIKEDEGFEPYPYWEYAQFTVGYGTRCPDDKLNEDRERGITREEAEALLRKMIGEFEEELNK